MFVTQLKEQLRIIKHRRTSQIYSFETFGIQKNLRTEHEQITLGELKDIFMNVLKIGYLYDPVYKEIQQIQKFGNGCNSTNIKLKTILKILGQGLFYRHMINNKTICNILQKQVHNFLTDVNRKIAFAAILVYSTRKLTIKEIDISMLIFNLESALLHKRFQKIPVDANFLNKILGKIDRTIHINELKQFIHKVNKSRKQVQYLEPYQFLFLTALSSKKSSANNIVYFHRQNHHKFDQDILLNQSYPSHLDTTKKGRSKTLHDKKVQGLSFYTEQQQNKNKQVYQKIKRCLRPFQRSKSTIIDKQVNKMNRPPSPTFQKSIICFNNFIKQSKAFDSKVKRIQGKSLKLRKKTKLKIQY